MQPKAPLRISRPHTWSRNTNYIGAVGKHSENSAGANARRTSIDNHLNTVVSVLKEMQRKEFQRLERSKRNIQNSMLAYTERVKEINAKRDFSISTEANASNTTSTANSSSLRTPFPSDRSSQNSSHSEVQHLRRSKMSPLKSRRLSLPKFGSPEQKKVHQRRHSSVSQHYLLPSALSTKTSSPKLLRNNLSGCHSSSSCSSDEDTNNVQSDTSVSADGKKQEDHNVRISPFPYESYNRNDEIVYTTSSNECKSEQRKRVSYKQYREEKEIERERMSRKKAVSDHDPYDHKKEIQREQAKHRRAAIMLERARQEALKNKRDICNTFCYSFAMEELLKKSTNPLTFKSSEKDMVSKIEVDKDGTIKQTLGPAVLTIIGVDELNNYHGMRIKWSAKYRPPIANGSDDDLQEQSFLPPITVGGHKHIFSREATRETENLRIENMYDTRSITSAVSVDG